MNYNFSEEVLLSDEHLKKLSYLAYPTEARQIISLISIYTKKLKRYLKLSFYLNFVSTLSIFIFLSFSILFIQASQELAIYAVIGILFVQILAVIIKTKKNEYLHKYSRTVEDLGDNLLSFVLDDYRLSLSDSMPEFSQVKEMSKSISGSAISVRNYYTFIYEFIAVILGLSLVMFYSFFSGSALYSYLALEILAITALILVHALLEGTHVYYEKDHVKQKEMYDRNFKDSESLLTRTVIKFNETKYLRNLASGVGTLVNMELVGGIMRNLLPVIILFVPLFILGTYEAYVFVVTGLFVLLRLSTNTNVLEHRAQIISGKKMLKRLDQYLDTIFTYGLEMTPNLYKNFKKDFLEQNPKEKTGDRIIWGDLHIEGLHYTSGRDKNKREIYLDKAVLPYGKVSMMIGEYGVGKSLFGRLITLRYAHFSADTLSIGEKDLRTFKNLDTAFKYFHLSGLRSISTSYRNAISSYISGGSFSNVLVRKIFSPDVDLEQVKKHFKDNSVYYEKVLEHILPVLEKKHFLDPKDNPSNYTDLVSELFRNLSYYKPTDIVLRQLEKSISEKILSKGLMYAAIAEYLSFDHLKTYVPESTLYFMDVDLSKPPVSEEMKLRFLYALDVFMEGLIFVVDDPFSNLDVKDAKRIFEDLVNYAKNYNAVVLILDEKVYHEIIQDYRGKGVLGKKMTFEDDGFSISIKSQDLE